MNFIFEAIYDIRCNSLAVVLTWVRLWYEHLIKGQRWLQKPPLGTMTEPHLLTGVQLRDDKPLKIACDWPDCSWLSDDNAASLFSNVEKNIKKTLGPQPDFVIFKENHRSANRTGRSPGLQNKSRLTHSLKRLQETLGRLSLKPASSCHQLSCFWTWNCLNF